MAVRTRKFANIIIISAESDRIIIIIIIIVIIIIVTISLLLFIIIYYYNSILNAQNAAAIFPSGVMCKNGSVKVPFSAYFMW